MLAGHGARWGDSDVTSKDRARGGRVRCQPQPVSVHIYRGGWCTGWQVGWRLLLAEMGILELIKGVADDFSTLQ